MTSQAQHLDRIEAYEVARKSWLKAIDERMPHPEINARWKVVVLRADRIGIVPGLKART